MAQVQADDGHQRDQAVAQDVADQDLARRQPFGVRRANVVGAHDVEQAAAQQSRHDRGGGDGQGQRRQDDVARALSPRHRQPAQAQGEEQDEQQPAPEGWHGQAQRGAGHQQQIEGAAGALRGDDPTERAQRQRQARRRQRQRRRVWEALGEQRADWPRADEGTSQVAAQCHPADELRVAKERRAVESQRLAQFGQLLRRRALAHHGLRCVAGGGVQRQEGDQAHRQQDEDAAHRAASQMTQQHQRAATRTSLMSMRPM